jgi:hypothetical protein
MLDPDPMTESFDRASSKLAPGMPSSGSESDFWNMEVLGSVPIWVLSGLRLKRTGSRRITAGWEVGVFRINLTKDDDKNFLG